MRTRAVEYSDPNGLAACGTARYPIPAVGTDTKWVCWISYDAFILPPGKWIRDPRTGQQVYQRQAVNLVANPVLFLDNFGVMAGQPVQFQVLAR